MKTFDLSIRTTQRCQMVDITAQVTQRLKEQTVTDGIITLFVPHTTAAITINENADPDVVTDILYALDKLVPDDPAFRHAEGNSAAHLKSSLIGASETVILQNSRLQLGTWQGLYFCEFDGPRTRKVRVTLSPAPE